MFDNCFDNFHCLTASDFWGLSHDLLMLSCILTLRWHMFAWRTSTYNNMFVHTWIYIYIYTHTHYVNNISITRKFCMYDMICMVIVRSVTYGAMLEVSRGIWGKGCHVLWKMRSNILAICEGKVRFRDKGSETPWDPLKLQAIKHN